MLQHCMYQIHYLKPTEVLLVGFWVIDADDDGEEVVAIGDFQIVCDPVL